MNGTLICPSCAEPLPGPIAACPACALPLLGPAAGRLWQVDQQLLALRDERVRLLAELRDPARTSGGPNPGGPKPGGPNPGGPNPGGPTTGGPTAGGPTAGALTPGAWTPPADGEPVSGQAARIPPTASRTGQRVLLGTGVMLLIVASAVFLAVTWGLIGVGGQVTVMLLATVVAARSALRVSRRGLPQTAEALAVLTAGLLTVELGQARSLGFAGLDHITRDTYIAGAATVGALLLGALASRDRRIIAARIACAGASAIAVVAAVESAEPPLTGRAVAYLVAAGAFGVFGQRIQIAHRSASVNGVAFLGLGIATAIAGTIVESSAAASLGCSATLLGTGIVAGAVRDRVDGAWLRAVLVGAVAVCVPAGVVSAAAEGGSATLVGVGVALAAAAAAAMTTFPRRWALLAHVTALVAVAVLLVRADTGAAALILAALALSAASTAWSQSDLRAESAGCAAVAGAGAIVLGTPELPGVADPATVAVSVALTTYAVLLAALSAWRLRRPEELTLGPVSALVAGLAATATLDHPAHAVLLSLVLAVSGLTMFGYGLLPGRGALAAPAVLSCSAATWVLSHDAGVYAIEAYSLPLAVLSLLVGLIRWRRYPGAPSWTTVGPASSAALLPSAWASIADPGLTRPLLTLAAALVVLFVGVRLHWNSPVVTGSVAAGVVAFSQLAPYAVGLPRWLSLGTAGALLLGVGVTYERRRVQLHSAADWVSTLH